MKNEQPRQPTQDTPTTARLLGRRLARELSKDEIDAIAGGMRKAPVNDSGHGTGSGPWGELDDGS